MDDRTEEFVLRHIKCPICEVDDSRELGWRGGRFHRYGLGIEVRIVECRRCRLVYPDPFPFPLRPQELYGDPDKYFGISDDTEKLALSRVLLDDLINRSGTDRPTILDIGCGQGELLAVARERRLDAVGLEFSEAMIRRARERYGLSIVRSSAEDYARAAGRTFDIVVLSAVIEHVHDPDGLIASVRALTHSGSLVYIDTPNEPNLLTRVGNLMGRIDRSRRVYNLSPTWPPFHVFGFNRTSLKRLLDKHAMLIERVRIHAVPNVPSRADRLDRVRALVATQVNRVANLTGTARNLYVWARRAPQL